jgi:hypothetical protein
MNKASIGPLSSRLTYINKPNQKLQVKIVFEFNTQVQISIRKLEVIKTLVS